MQSLYFAVAVLSVLYCTLKVNNSLVISVYRVTEHSGGKHFVIKRVACLKTLFCLCMEQLKDLCDLLTSSYFRIVVPNVSFFFVMCRFFWGDTGRCCVEPQGSNHALYSAHSRFNATLPPCPHALAAILSVMWGFNPVKYSVRDSQNLCNILYLRMLPMECLCEN